MNTRNTRPKITRIFNSFLTGLCLLGLGLNNAVARELIGLDYSVMTGNAVQLVFTFDEDAIEPRTFTIDQPARIALDFADTTNSLRQRNLQVGIGNLQNIISAAAQGRTRVVLNLTRNSDYAISLDGNQMTLTLGEPGQPLPVSSQSDAPIT